MAYNPQPDQPVLSNPSALRGCYRLWWLRQQMTECILRRFGQYLPCSACHGTGISDWGDDRCPACSGTGQTPA